MRELQKIGEANYFLGRMTEESHAYPGFPYNVSAFLTASRSALQYMLKEAEQKTGGQQWYEGWIKSDPALPFFRDKRDINIHEEPIRTNLHITIPATLVPRGSLSSRHTDKDGNIIDERELDSPETEQLPAEPGSIKGAFFFDDWPSQDCLALCTHYLKLIQKIRTDGIAKGFYPRSRAFLKFAGAVFLHLERVTWPAHLVSGAQPQSAFYLASPLVDNF